MYHRFVYYTTQDYYRMYIQTELLINYFTTSFHLKGFVLLFVVFYQVAKGELRSICVTNDHGCVPLVISTSQSFPHS
jgi:hypothetical protein